MSAELAHCHHHLGGPLELSKQLARSVLLLFMHISANQLHHRHGIHLFLQAQHPFASLKLWLVVKILRGKKAKLSGFRVRCIRPVTIWDKYTKNISF